MVGATVRCNLGATTLRVLGTWPPASPLSSAEADGKPGTETACGAVSQLALVFRWIPLGAWFPDQPLLCPARMIPF